jgi:hypothetical protein
MNGKLYALGGALLMGLSGAAIAAPAAETDLAKTVEALQARVNELESKQSSSWLNERRAEEVKALVREVLSDADTRASLLNNEAQAGYNNGFFLASGDGAFLLRVSGQIQFRHYANYNSDFENESEHGFQTGEGTYVDFAGHISSPKIGYQLRLKVDFDNNEVVADRVLITYQITDTLQIWAGEGPANFAREEQVESGHQMAVERSVVNELFTLGTVQGIGINWDAHEQVKVAIAYSDGSHSGEANGNNDKLFEGDNDKIYNEDDTDVALTARVDVLISGEWAQGQDFAAWSGQPMFLALGAALHWEQEAGGDGDSNGSFYTLTVDAQFEYQGFSAFGAFFFSSNDDDDDAEADVWGLVIQAAYNINDKFEPFVRYEYIDLDDLASENQVSIVTFGANWYINKHDTKITADILWVLDETPDLDGIASDTLSLLGLETGEEDYVVFRVQVQIRY